MPTVTFVDSNVWLYALLDKQEPRKRDKARQIITRTNLVISTQVVNEVCANLIRKSKAPESEIARVLELLYRGDVRQLHRSTFADASRLRSRYSLSYWDSIIIAAALKAEATVLLTEDMQDGLIVDGQVTIINPFVSTND